MTQNLVLQLLLATAMAAFTVVMHLGGLTALIAATNRHARHLQADRTLISQALILVGVSFGLFTLHGVEIWAYAVLYQLLGAIRSFEDALYFSTATYSTIGYGDVALTKSWRVLGAIEGANGVILLGWSTAFFVSVVGRIRALEHDWSDTSGDRAHGPTNRENQGAVPHVQQPLP